MRITKWIYIVGITILISCGSSERVITNNGTVYEVKGNNFYNKGKDVTDKLTDIEKKSIQSILEKRLEAEEAAKEKQDEIAKSLDALKDKEKQLKDKQREIEDKIANREDARDDFFEVKKKLNDLKEEYKVLKDKGELSPNDESKWRKRLKKLEKKLKEAELEVDN
ncbi:MAG: hypothetical protein WA839_10280 [Flavobacteriaceae bacterium]